MLIEELLKTLHTVKQAIRYFISMFLFVTGFTWSYPTSAKDRVPKVLLKLQLLNTCCNLFVLMIIQLLI